MNHKEDTPNESKRTLIIEANKSWKRLQRAKEFFFADLEAQMKENHRRFLMEAATLFDGRPLLNRRLTAS
jgi:hypothetical protein